MTFTTMCLTGFAAATLALGYSGSSFSEKFEAMPKAAQETALANMENALPISVSSVQGDHGWEYQINTRLNGDYHNLVIDERGRLLAIKDETDLASVPAVVKTAIAKEGAASKLVTLEKVTEGGLVSYGAVIQQDAQGKFVRIRLAADGTLTAKKQQDTER